MEGKINVPPNRGQLASISQLSLGAPFEEDQVAHAVESIKRTFESNGLYEAQVTPETERDSKTQQVFIKFAIKEGKRAKFEMPIIRGNTGLSDNIILRATGWRIPIIHWWRSVTDSRTHQGVRSVLGKYQKQDRLTTRVELEKLDYDTAHRRVQPSLLITPGPRVTVKAVEAKVSQRVLKRYVPVYQEKAVDNDLLVEGKRNLRDYFQSKGYYDVDVDFRVEPPQNDLQTIEYVISRGTRYKLSHLKIVGNKYFTDATIRERMFMQPAVFNLRRGRYSEAFRRKDEESIATLYRSNGFRGVKVASTVDHNYQGKQGSTAVTVNIVEGPQWLVDELTVEIVA